MGLLDEFKKAFQTSAVGNFGSGWTWLVKKLTARSTSKHGCRRHPDHRRQGPAVHRRGNMPTTSTTAAAPEIRRDLLNNLVNWAFAEQNYAG